MEEKPSPSPSAAQRDLVVVPATMTNREFLERHARPGCIGLSGGTTLIDRAIARAERHVDPDERWSQWSHAFVFGERRADGWLWVIESDLKIHRKHIQLGVQENRVTKYHDEKLYTTLAVLDFGLPPEQVTKLLTTGLDLVANRARYSLRELLGTLIALRRPALRGRGNVLAREQCFFCSAFVQHLFRETGFDLTPGLHAKLTTPEDLARTPAPHTAYVLQREVATSKLRALAGRLRRRVRLTRRRTAR